MHLKSISSYSRQHMLTATRFCYLVYEILVSSRELTNLNNNTVVSSSSNDKDIQKEVLKCKGKISKSTLVGKHLGEKLNKMKIKNIIFDRNGYNYHGRVKALADAMREMKIKF